MNLRRKKGWIGGQFFAILRQHDARVKVLTTVIPVFNGEKFIAGTLLSVAKQTRRPDRVIVLDNCSTDGTRRVVEQFTALPCEWRQNEKNLGLFGNQNRALGFSPETQYLHLLHADDLIKPAFYERCLDTLKKFSGRSLVYCPAEFIDEQGQPLSETVLSAQQTRVLAPERFISHRQELQPIYFCGVVLKTNGQNSPCQFRLDLPQLADHVFWAEWAGACSHVVAIADALCQYRVHPGGDTRRNLTDLQAWVLDEWKAMRLISQLPGASARDNWLRRHKLRCLFAARSRVKMDQVHSAAPEFAQAIRNAARGLVGPMHWLAGGLAVRGRKWFSPGSCLR